MSSQATFINVLKFEQAMAKKVSGSNSGNSVAFKIQKVKHKNGNWNLKLTSAVPKEVKAGLGDIIGALQKRELKTDVLTKENK